MQIPIERFSKVPLFEGLSSDQIMSLLRVSHYLDAKAGDIVIQQGESCDGVYIIASGAFEVYLESDDEKQVVARLEDLSVFGEMSLVTDARRAATVVCVEPGRLKRIPVETYRRLIAEDDIGALKVAYNMSRIIAKRLMRLQEDRLVGAPAKPPPAPPIQPPPHPAD